MPRIESLEKAASCVEKAAEKLASAGQSLTVTRPSPSTDAVFALLGGVGADISEAAKELKHVAAQLRGAAAEFESLVDDD